MKRLFFALWPSDEVRRRCAELSRTVSVSGEQRVRPENLHVTLVFLGSVNTDTEAAILQAASAISPPKLTITFDRLEFWRRPRILCLSGHTAEPGLGDLVDQLNKIARMFSLAVDERPYTAHVTLARKATASRKMEFAPLLWQTDSFCLVESRSGSEGVEYRVIKEWKSRRNGT